MTQPRDKASCEAAGGRWGQFGLDTTERCNMPTRDAGKACQSGRECESRLCIADERTAPGAITSGTCYGWTIPAGCFNVVDGGASQGTICID